MKFVALISGGKDSIYTICKLVDEGHELVGLLHMRCNDIYTDSYMYQTVGSEIIKYIAECLDKPLYIHNTNCRPVNIGLEYTPTVDDEVEDMYTAVNNIKNELDFTGISSGAILSTYQKNRVENVCARLSLTSLAPLWNRNQEELLKEMIDYGMEAKIIKIASPIFSKNCLNMDLKSIYEYMKGIKSKYELNYCGEGGEYETAVVDCPHFVKKVILGDPQPMEHPEEKDRDGCVHYLTFSEIKTVNKF